MTGAVDKIVRLNNGDVAVITSASVIPGHSGDWTATLISGSGGIIAFSDSDIAAVLN